MPSSKPTDELLAALPDVGLQLWILSDNGEEGWYAIICEPGNAATGRHGNGATAAAALIEALKAHGVEVTDDPG